MYHNHFDALLQLQWRTKKKLINDDTQAAYTSIRLTKFSTSWAFYCRIDSVFLHVDRAPPAKCMPRLLPPVPAPRISISTLNSQLCKPVSRLRVQTKQSKPPQLASRLQKPNTKSAHSQLWSPHSPHLMTSAATHLCSIEAPLINTIVIVKPPIMNIKHNNPSKHKRNFEENSKTILYLGGAGFDWGQNKERKARETKWNGGAAFTPPNPSR